MRCHRVGDLCSNLVAVAIVVSLESCGEIQDTSYATRNEAQTRGAMDKGWVPHLLPGSAVRIHEAHNLDTNETWGKFEFTGQDKAWVRGKLVEVDSERLAGRVVRAPERLQWWPTPLRGTLQEQALSGTGLSFYEATDDGRLIVGVDWTMRRAFYWRSPS